MFEVQLQREQVFFPPACMNRWKSLSIWMQSDYRLLCSKWKLLLSSHTLPPSRRPGTLARLTRSHLKQNPAHSLPSAFFVSCPHFEKFKGSPPSCRVLLAEWLQHRWRDKSPFTGCSLSLICCVQVLIIFESHFLWNPEEIKVLH